MVQMNNMDQQHRLDSIHQRRDNSRHQTGQCIRHMKGIRKLSKLEASWREIVTICFFFQKYTSHIKYLSTVWSSTAATIQSTTCRGSATTSATYIGDTKSSRSTWLVSTSSTTARVLSAAGTGQCYNCFNKFYSFEVDLCLEFG